MAIPNSSPRGPRDWLMPSPSPQYKVYRVPPADWERHVANNHTPYRRDCAVCVHGGWGGPAACRSGTPTCRLKVRRQSRANPHSWSRSRNHKPTTFKYFLSVSYRFPRLKGVKEESDPAKTEGFDDPALLPRGTDDLGTLVPRNVRITKILCTAPAVVR